ncbi:MAG: SAVED domain-containing protein [Candidatus Cloacimonetes bacterium]|nr:SAVED domain-containing protein [Candidatus Cloacimonadota bacterium]
MVAPRLEGDEYQSLFFWYHAASLLSKDNIKEICYESDEVDGVDDLIVYYNASGVDAGGWNSTADYFQVKYHVDNRNRYSSEAIINPQFINCQKSLLKHFYDAHESILSMGINHFRLFLVSNWQWDQNDPLFCEIRDSDGSLPTSFFRQRNGQRIGRIRESWRKHLNIDEHSFVSFAQKLRFQMNHFGRKYFKELVMSNLRNAGLVVQDDFQTANTYSSLALKFIMDGTKRFTRESLRKVCIENKLITDGQTCAVKVPIIGIRSFIRFAERIEDECDSHICLSEHFEGRHINDGANWNIDISSKLLMFLSHPDFLNIVRATDHHILLECHGSIALLAGYLLPRTSGARIHPIQKGIETQSWRPKGDKKEDWDWDINYTKFISSSTDIVISVSLTHDIKSDVEKFVSENDLQAQSMYCFNSKSGNGQNCIENADHAIHLSDSIVQKIRQLRQGNPNSTIHLFIAAPNGFMFLLGRIGMALGSIQLYEFDFTNEKNGSYTPSIRLPLSV